MWIRLVKEFLTAFTCKGFLIFFERVTVSAGFHPALSKFLRKPTVLCFDIATDLGPVS